MAIAIIDQTLLVDHIEYKDRIRLYEEASDDSGGWQQVQIHGPAVASRAVGKTAGVAPDVFRNTARKIERIIQIQHDGKEYQFVVIVDLQALIHALQSH